MAGDTTIGPSTGPLRPPTAPLQAPAAPVAAPARPATARLQGETVQTSAGGLADAEALVAAPQAALAAFVDDEPHAATPAPHAPAPHGAPAAATPAMPANVPPAVAARVAEMQRLNPHTRPDVVEVQAASQAVTTAREAVARREMQLRQLIANAGPALTEAEATTITTRFRQSHPEFAQLAAAEQRLADSMSGPHAQALAQLLNEQPGSVASRMITEAAHNLASSPTHAGTAERLAVAALEGTPLNPRMAAQLTEQVLMPAVNTLAQRSVGTPEGLEAFNREQSELLGNLAEKLQTNSNETRQQGMQIQAVLRAGNSLQRLREVGAESAQALQTFHELGTEVRGLGALGRTFLAAGFLTMPERLRSQDSVTGVIRESANGARDMMELFSAARGIVEGTLEHSTTAGRALSRGVFPLLGVVAGAAGAYNMYANQDRPVGAVGEALSSFGSAALLCSAFIPGAAVVGVAAFAAGAAISIGSDLFEDRRERREAREENIRLLHEAGIPEATAQAMVEGRPNAAAGIARGLGLTPEQAHEFLRTEAGARLLDPHQGNTADALRYMAQARALGFDDHGFFAQLAQQYPDPQERAQALASAMQAVRTVAFRAIEGRSSPQAQSAAWWQQQLREYASQGGGQYWQGRSLDLHPHQQALASLADRVNP